MSGLKQSRAMSMLESGVNIGVGFGISLAAQMVFLPMLGVEIAFKQNFAFALIMTAISILRSYLLRRLFEALHIRVPLSPFMLAVIAERRRQIEVEGWTAEHDAQQKPGVLALAGASYLRQAHLHLIPGANYVMRRLQYVPSFWPLSDEWFKPQDFRRDLVKGCALGIAEGEKFDNERRRRK